MVKEIKTESVVRTNIALNYDACIAVLRSYFVRPVLYVGGYLVQATGRITNAFISDLFDTCSV